MATHAGCDAVSDSEGIDASAHGSDAQRLERHIFSGDGFSGRREGVERIGRLERARKDSTPKPPIEAYFRVIDEPVLRLTSIDLAATADIASFGGVFDFGRDYLGLLKAAVIASGLVPPAMEGIVQPVSELLDR